MRDVVEADVQRDGGDRLAGVDQPVGCCPQARRHQVLVRALADHRYVIERRVAAARALLMETGLSIAQVALEVGFAHQSHLTRCMRRLTGLTPGEIVRARSS